MTAASVLFPLSSSFAATPKKAPEPPPKTRVVQGLEIYWNREGTTPIKGQISAIVLSTRSVTIGVLRQAQKFKIAENCAVKLNDNPTADVKDLRMGMNVVAHIFVVRGTAVAAKITEVEKPVVTPPPKKKKKAPAATP